PFVSRLPGGGAPTGSTCRVAVRAPAGPVAVSSTVAGAETGKVTTEKVVVTAPAGTMTTAGTVAAAGALLVSETTRPSGGTGPRKVRRPTVLCPPVTGLGSIPRRGAPGGVSPTAVTER